jgi:hypothetical protein
VNPKFTTDSTVRQSPADWLKTTVMHRSKRPSHPVSVPAWESRVARRSKTLIALPSRTGKKAKLSLPL